MTTNAASIVIYVTYQGTPVTRFDRNYHVAHHLNSDAALAPVLAWLTQRTASAA